MLYVLRVVALPIVCQDKRFRSAAALLLLCAVACARTGLYPGELGDGELGSADASGGGSGPSNATGGGSAGGTPLCEPSPETCKGRDDDCNGAVVDLPA